MIDVSNLKDALETLGFVAHGDIHEKVFSEIGCSLKVDFQAKRLIYPNEIKGRERNDGFDQKENFVVFECVCRLLSKGYRPEHIELEKEWHLGHDAKGGRADICVSDTNGNMLFIIECKTWGREYDKALNNTKSDGAQLFSYWQQEQSCKWLVLYASDLRSGCIAYKAPTIDCSDDANIILLSKKDKSIKLYRDAHTTSAKYEAWKETYGSQIHDDLIFSEDSVAYQIGVKPLRKKDLRDFTPDDKIVNKFEEILRHNKDVLGKYHCILNVFRKARILEVEDGHKYRRFVAGEVPFADKNCILFDYSAMHAFSEKTYKSLDKNYKKAFYLSRLRRYDEAFFHFSEIAKQAFKDSDYLLYYFAESNCISLRKVIKNVNTWYRCYDLDAVEALSPND